MAVEIPYRREFAFEYGRLEPVAPGVRRIVAQNPGPFTFRGTGTYVVGEGEVAVIDPGPDLAQHVDALLASLAGERISHILVTHTHNDHSPAAKPLKEATGAPTYGFGPHAGGRRGEAGSEAGGDWDFVPDIVLKRGRRIEEVPSAEVPEWVRHTVRLKPVTGADFAIPWSGGEARAIWLVTDQVVTESLTV